MVKSKKSLGKKIVVEIELDQNSDKSYISEEGIISHNCKYCKKFHVDSDGSPVVYSLSTILGNGSNYGKKPVDWKPIAGATHPNDRESSLIELKPGFVVKADGSQTYIGLKSWTEYIKAKVRK